MADSYFLTWPDLGSAGFCDLRDPQTSMTVSRFGHFRPSGARSGRLEAAAEAPRRSERCFEMLLEPPRLLQEPCGAGLRRFRIAFREPRGAQRRLPRLVGVPNVVSRCLWGFRGVSRSVLERVCGDFGSLSEPLWRLGANID